MAQAVRHSGTIRAPQLSLAKRKLLVTLIRYCAAFTAVACVYTLLDFAVDIRPSGIQESYRFTLRDFAVDRVEILRQDNLAILVIKRSDETIAELENSDFARNALRSRHPGYFVSYAIGTDLGCPVAAVGQELGEVCGSARYDFAGRAFKGAKKFQNLDIPDYTFASDFSTLTIRP